MLVFVQYKTTKTHTATDMMLTWSPLVVGVRNDKVHVATAFFRTLRQQAWVNGSQLNSGCDTAFEQRMISRQ